MCKLCMMNQLHVTAESISYNSSVTEQKAALSAQTADGVSAQVEVTDFLANTLVMNEGEDADAGPSTQYLIAAGDSFSGTLETNGDRDWVAIDLSAGSNYTINLNGSGAAPVTDTYLRIYDASGNLVAFDDDGGSGLNSSLNFIASTSGRFYISAAAYSDGQTGSYTVSVEETLPPSPLDALDWGGSAVDTTNISVYFAQAGEVFDGQSSDGWTQAQIDGAMASLNDLSQGTNLTFSVASSSNNAEFKFVTSAFGGSTYAYMNPPSEANPGVAVFNTSNMNLANLDPGSLEYFVFQHEVGHGLGMAHPHDTGGGSSVMNGVSSSRGDYGDFDLNQGIYTMMSYNVGHAELYPEWPSTYGATVGPMAFDLALLQEKYGAKDANIDNNTYLLPELNGSGTFYSCIWDTGGIDTIAYTGFSSVNISLVAATLDYSSTGGGVLSYAEGVRGGYTIANGVEIENASGGAGSDTVVGNSLENVLQGFSGDDFLDGAQGDDLLEGGAGRDTFSFTSIGDTDTIADFQDSVDFIQLGSEFGANSFTELSLTNRDADVIVAFGDSEIILQNTDLSLIGAEDFIFV
ncbi:Serralysin C precursor [Pseudovibrio sp. WM33]|nr:Serralysin C precursor [Pseudovibrio sp. WM33]